MTSLFTRIISLVCACILFTVAGCSNEQVQQSNLNQEQSQPHMSWSGDVDAGVTVFVQGGKAWIDDVSGKPVQNSASNFQGVLPNSDGVSVSLSEKSGRGDIEIVQQPTKDNNYTAGVRILDPEPASDHYQFTLKW